MNDDAGMFLLSSVNYRRLEVVLTVTSGTRLHRHGDLVDSPSVLIGEAERDMLGLLSGL